jgi:methylmalonyl-CoA mutase N-terminal domain/subunit
LEENIETERTQQEATLQVRLTQIQDLQQHHDMAAVEQQIVALTHQCRQLEALSLQYSGEHVAHKRSVQDEVEHALQEIANFERHVQNTFDDLERYALHTKQGLVVTVTSPRKL